MVDLIRFSSFCLAYELSLVNMLPNLVIPNCRVAPFNLWKI
jgi:hypothetical protein